MACLLVIVDDLYVVRICTVPSKTDSVLIVDADAVLSGAIALELFEPVRRRSRQVDQAARFRKHPELSQSDPGDGLEPPGRLPVPDRFRLRVLEALEHSSSI